jgi:hypothetical protein
MSVQDEIVERIKANFRASAKPTQPAKQPAQQQPAEKLATNPKATNPKE